MAWALGRFELLPRDKDVDPIDVTDSVGLLEDRAASLIFSATIRPLAEREALRKVMYAVHVRLVVARRSPRPDKFRTSLDPSWFPLLRLPLELTPNGDRMIDGLRILEVSEERRRRVEQAIGKRHRASIWLVGEERVYHETPADT